MGSWQERIREIVRASSELKEAFLRREGKEVERAARLLVEVVRSGGKIFLFGNGGSAADAQHIAAEFVNRFRRDRRALPAVALTTDSSVLTSIANDTDFSLVFARQLEALGSAGDLAWGITTSGRSPNVIRGLKRATELGLRTLVFSGGDGGEAAELAEVALVVPSFDTPRVQEVHILLGHILCELVEDELF
ncbi:MAG: phosphoheptose isomerase [Deltaproteobacteria bacterium]|nr:MAG: phosphoheptose isomerase [Deltaproteobacteria bacterium]HEX16533.1 SIS domain-containing protein [Deltaproteobacteria bacterium]